MAVENFHSQPREQIPGSPGVRLIIPSRVRKHITLVRSLDKGGNVEYRLPGTDIFTTCEQLKAFDGNEDTLLKLAEKSARKALSKEIGLGILALYHMQADEEVARIDPSLRYFVVTDWVSYSRMPSDAWLETRVVWPDLQRAREAALDGSLIEPASAKALLQYLDIRS